MEYLNSLNLILLLWLLGWPLNSPLILTNEKNGTQLRNFYHFLFGICCWFHLGFGHFCRRHFWEIVHDPILVKKWFCSMNLSFLIHLNFLRRPFLPINLSEKEQIHRKLPPNLIFYYLVINNKLNKIWFMRFFGLIFGFGFSWKLVISLFSSSCSFPKKYDQ